MRVLILYFVFRPGYAIIADYEGREVKEYCGFGDEQV